MEQPPLKILLEAAIMGSDAPIALDRLSAMFADLGDDAPSREVLDAALTELAQDYADRGIELAEVGGGWRFQTRASCAPWINRLWEERKPRYSRALLETLAIMAYRQPITRAEIEDIRGVAVSSGIIKTLHERGWIKVVGHRDVPGRPAIFATTREFLSYFNLSSLSDLPTLAELRDIDELNPDLFADFEAQAAEAEAALAAEPKGEAIEDEIAPEPDLTPADGQAPAVDQLETGSGDAEADESDADESDEDGSDEDDADEDDSDEDDSDEDDSDEDDSDEDDSDEDDADEDDEDEDDEDEDDADEDDADEDDADEDDADEDDSDEEEDATRGDSR